MYKKHILPGRNLVEHTVLQYIHLCSFHLQITYCSNTVKMPRRSFIFYKPVWENLYQRWGFPIEFRYSDIPIAIGLRKTIGEYLTNIAIGLFNYRTNSTGLPVVHYYSCSFYRIDSKSRIKASKVCNLTHKKY
jgi:hypothetical protein